MERKISILSFPAVSNAVHLGIHCSTQTHTHNYRVGIAGEATFIVAQFRMQQIGNSMYLASEQRHRRAISDQPARLRSCHRRLVTPSQHVGSTVSGWSRNMTQTALGVAKSNPKEWAQTRRKPLRVEGVAARGHAQRREA